MAKKYEKLISDWSEERIARVRNRSAQLIAHLDDAAPVLERAITLFGSEARALEWLDTRLPVLAGLAPADILCQPGRQGEILDLLGRIEHGLPD